jgi:hypothetical protein
MRQNTQEDGWAMAKDQSERGSGGERGGRERERRGRKLETNLF